MTGEGSMKASLARARRALVPFVAGVLAASLGSCAGGPKGPPAPPDFTATQRAVWQRVPADALGALVIADFGHLLGRLAALRQVLATGPATKGYLDRGLAVVTTAVGFDPLDAAAWRQAGLDPSGPLAVL